MIAFIFALLLLALAVVSVTLRRTYGWIPVHELRRQAQSGDPLARTLYRVAAYGAPAQALLWGAELLSLAGSMILLSNVVPDVILFGYVVVVVGYVLMWLPHTEITPMSLRITAWSTPVVVWLVSRIFPLLDRPASAVAHRRPEHHTGLYERDDLLHLLERQKAQDDNRLSETEISQLLHALTYDRKKVSDILSPRKAVQAVSADDTIGPILLDKLHGSGRVFFPVYDGQNEDHVVGTLYLSDAVRAKEGGRISQVMRPEVFYVHEDYSIEQLLHAFLTTKQQVLVVINNFEEYVGLVVIEDALRHVVGHDIKHDFTQYDDIHAVAAGPNAKTAAAPVVEDQPADADAIAL